MRKQKQDDSLEELRKNEFESFKAREEWEGWMENFKRFVEDLPHASKISSLCLVFFI